MMVQGCPICGALEYLPMADRPAARCGGCGSLERQRAFVSATSRLLASGEGRACLEVGPLNSQAFGAYMRDRAWNYVSVDRWRHGHPNDPRNVEFIDFEADLTELPFEDDSFDLFLAQHVLEEIEDYESALREVLRVLSGEGIALIEVPISKELAHTESQAADHYGNVWRFGRDTPDLFKRIFPRVESLPLRDGDFRGTLLACANK